MGREQVVAEVAKDNGRMLATFRNRGFEIPSAWNKTWRWRRKYWVDPSEQHPGMDVGRADRQYDPGTPLA